MSFLYVLVRLSSWCIDKEYACQCRKHRRLRFDPWVGMTPWSRKCARDQREESRPWQGHAEGSLTKRKDVIRLQGFPLEFPEHVPLKNKNMPAFVLCSSDILWKKSNQGFSLLHLKGMFQLNPSDSSLACLTGSPGPLTACELLTAPHLREAQSLKAS